MFALRILFRGGCHLLFFGLFVFVFSFPVFYIIPIFSGSNFYFPYGHLIYPEFLFNVVGFVILGCLFQYKNETTLGLTRRTLEGLVAWQPLFNNRGQGHLYSEDSLNVRCGKLSCLAPLSLLAALIFLPVLLHSVWSGE